ncbi:Protein of unknown function, partial [Cotesia congregata]
MDTDVYNDILQAMESAYDELPNNYERFQRQLHGVVRGGSLDPHQQVQLNDQRVIWRDVESAFASRIRTGMVVNLLHIDLKAFLLEAKELIIEQINNALQTNGSIKANVILTCTVNFGKQLLKNKFKKTLDDDDDDDTIHLLMVEVQSDDTKMNIDDDNFENRVNNFERKFHFATIQDLSRLLSSQISQHNGRKFFCDRCLCHFQDAIVFNKHRRDCIQINKVKIELAIDEKVSFKNFKYQEDVPFVVYADIECLIVPKIDESEEHVPHSVAFYVHCSYDDSLSRFECNRREKCIEWFMDQLKSLAIS